MNPTLIGTQYRTRKYAAEFVTSIAVSEKVKIRKKLGDVKFVSAIADGSTDSSYQETEIVYVRHCHSGKVCVNFSMVKNSSKADSIHISNIICEGVSNLTGNLEKHVATGTDGASVMLGSKTGAVQRIREKLNRPWLIGMHCAGHKLELWCTRTWCGPTYHYIGR